MPAIRSGKLPGLLMDTAHFGWPDNRPVQGDYIVNFNGNGGDAFDEPPKSVMLFVCGFRVALGGPGQGQTGVKLGDPQNITTSGFTFSVSPGKADGQILDLDVGWIAIGG